MKLKDSWFDRFESEIEEREEQEDAELEQLCESQNLLLNVKVREDYSPQAIQQVRIHRGQYHEFR